MVAHKTKILHCLSMLTIIFPIGMSTVVGIVSEIRWEGNSLTWSDLDNILCNFCINNNIYVQISHADNGFLGAWLSIHVPSRGTIQFSLNNRLFKENEVMKKIESELNGLME